MRAKTVKKCDVLSESHTVWLLQTLSMWSHLKTVVCSRSRDKTWKLTKINVDFKDTTNSFPMG